VKDELNAVIGRWQFKIFFLGFFTHALCELGLTNELITATFYKQVEG
jgi:hypothetical protein